MASECQADTAVRMYESRAPAYDDTWHSSFTKRFVSYLPISPGQHVLDLACGTGLLSFLEADAVGFSGRVVGVDVTPAMLAEAESKKRGNENNYRHVDFYRGDILDLENIDAIRNQQFDIITVASAFVLFPEPVAAVQHWVSFLKPGGLIALDSTHPRNLVAGMIMELTSRRMGIDVPFNRKWSQSKDSLKQILETAGLQVEKVVTVENQAGFGKRFYDVFQADEIFDKTITTYDVFRAFTKVDVRVKAKEIFKEEWTKYAVDGKVEEVDSVYLGIARKGKL